MCGYGAKNAVNSVFERTVHSIIIQNHFTSIDKINIYWKSWSRNLEEAAKSLKFAFSDKKFAFSNKKNN